MGNRHFAINGREIVVVEVKTTLTLSYVKNFIQKILKNFTILNPYTKAKPSMVLLPTSRRTKVPHLCRKAGAFRDSSNGKFCQYHK